MTTRLKVFYDGACPLCVREIGFYRRLRGSENINWVDIAVGNGSDVAPGLSQCSALERLHVEDEKGNVHAGARAFAKMWEALPRFRLLGRFVQLPGVDWVVEGLYRVFLLVRPALQRLARKAGA